jgi:hypothetical protein
MTQSEVRKMFDRFLSDLLRGEKKMRDKKMGFDVIFWTSVPAITQRNDNIIAQGDWRTLHRCFFLFFFRRVCLLSRKGMIRLLRKAIGAHCTGVEGLGFRD